MNGRILTDPLLTHSLENVVILGPWGEAREKGMSHKPMPSNGLGLKAGERIRTADVQLGKLAFYH